MSKSKGNVVVPYDVLDAYGADAFRWYFFTSKHPWDGYQFSVDAVGESLRSFLLQLWNTYGFYTLYANAAGDGYARTEPSTALDRWVLVALRRRSPRSPTASRPTTRRPPAARSPPSSTSSPTGTSAARAGASGTATAPPSRRCTSAW